MGCLTLLSAVICALSAKRVIICIRSKAGLGAAKRMPMHWLVVPRQCPSALCWFCEASSGW